MYTASSKVSFKKSFSIEIGISWNRCASKISYLLKIWLNIFTCFLLKKLILISLIHTCHRLKYNMTSIEYIVLRVHALSISAIYFFLCNKINIFEAIKFKLHKFWFLNNNNITNQYLKISMTSFFL